jgi:hypothetical protein
MCDGININTYDIQYGPNGLFDIKIVPRYSCYSRSDCHKGDYLFKEAKKELLREICCRLDILMEDVRNIRRAKDYESLPMDYVL